MAQTINQVTLLGRLGADPEIKTLPSGAKLVTMSIATSRAWKNAKGEWEEKTQWHRVIAWQNEKGPRLVDACERLVKGAQVCVIGEIEYRSWPDRNGETRYITEIKVNVIVPLIAKAESSVRSAATPHPNDFKDLPPALLEPLDDLPF